jgi:predicted glycogen debranching enzyme
MEYRKHALVEQIRMVFPRETCADYYFATQKEWLETNGLGGYASSTLIGANARRHHGLLVAVLEDANRPYVLLSKIEENAYIHGRTWEMSTNQYPFIIFPEGHRHIERFEHDLHPRFVFNLGGVVVEKNILMIHGENTVVVRYRVLKADHEFTMTLRSLCAFREANVLTRENPDVTRAVEIVPHGCVIRPYEMLPPLYVYHSAGSLESKFHWYRNTEYRKEQELGLEFTEDLFSPSVLTAALQEDSVLDLVATTDARRFEDAQSNGAGALWAAELDRRLKLLVYFPLEHPLAKSMALTAEGFFCKDRDGGDRIVGGYHWSLSSEFDTVVALSGLTMTCRKESMARNTLRHLVQNRLKSIVEEKTLPGPSATWVLYYYVLVYNYLLQTDDFTFIKNELYDVLCEVLQLILSADGTGVRTAEDGLLELADSGHPVTWMDAVVDGRPVTPRAGKVVEVNAIWYNVLHVMRHLARRAGEERRAAEYGELADRVKQSFNATFWNGSGRYLYDFVKGKEANDDIRPNQIFAVSLPFDILDRERQHDVLDCVTRHLLTPFGLRTLAPGHRAYVGVYAGDRAQRRSAYHQGTVWPWLIGAYVEAYLKVDQFTPLARDHCRRHIELFRQALDDAGLNTISEIFDGDEPHLPKGRVSDAKAVAEVLRIIELLENSERYI